MQDFKVGKYEFPDAIGYIGYLDTGNIIAFVDTDGNWSVFNRRDEQGGVVGAPISIKGVTA